MQAVQYIRQIGDSRSLKLDDLPLSPGQTVEVIILPVDDDAANLDGLADSGLQFWDNPIDDEVWYDAVPPA